MNAPIGQPDPVTSIDWVHRANALQAPWGMFVDGEQRPAISGSVRAVLSPRDGATVVELGWADEKDVDVAVAAARRAFDEGPWPRLPARERGEILQRFAALVEQHRDEIALLVSLEMGKPISHAWRIELRALIRCLRFYGELADKGSGEVTPTVEGELSLVTREPAGVVAAVVPWNFPLTLGGWKFAPALAAGCTVVLKTAEQSPLSMQRVAQLGGAGLPPGQQPQARIPGTGRQVAQHHPSRRPGPGCRRGHGGLGDLLQLRRDVHGRLPPGRARGRAQIASSSGSSRRRRRGSRQTRCLPRPRWGPLVDRRSLDRIQAQLRAGQAQGAILRHGGSQVLADTGGAYLEPTVVTGAGPDNVLVRGGAFRPGVDRAGDRGRVRGAAGRAGHALRARGGRLDGRPGRARTGSPARSRPARSG